MSTSPSHERLAAVVHEASGIRLVERQRSFFEAALARAFPGTDTDAVLARLADPAQRGATIATLVEEVTVKETSFLRDRAQLDAIDWRALVARVRARHGDPNRELRVWTAACATGEEAYSLALLACEAFAPQSPPVRILGTDISTGAVARATRGSYRAASVRGLDGLRRRLWFHEQDGALVANDQLRELVGFATHNLVADPFPPLGEGPFDLVLCRNVLIYFDGDTVGRVLESLADSLAPGGELVLGVADALCASAVRSARDAERRTLLAERRPSQDVLGETAARIAAEPLDPDAHLRRGLAELDAGEAEAATHSLRRALYLDPQLGFAAFKLGVAFEALGRLPAAAQAYRRALRAADRRRHETYLAEVDVDDVPAAAQARLDALAAGSDAVA